MWVLDQRVSGAVVVAGVGCTGRGDDGFGPALAAGLAGAVGVLAIDCGERPEDFTGDIARRNPDTILIADAVDMGAEPGEVALIDASELPSGACDTHRPTLRAVMEYLQWRTGATVLLLGVQPGSLTAPGLSPAVAASTDRLQRILEAYRPPALSAKSSSPEEPS
jgi:hydrogenase 3 maturation protease